MKKYFINLDRANERRTIMEKMYPNITRIPAYDGKKLYKYKDIVIPKNTTANLSELGCTFSHIKAIITAYNNNESGVLIMEDDIDDTFKSKWKNNSWSAGAYYINKSGIDKIYNLYYSNGKISLNNSDHRADGTIIYGVIKTYNYTKPLFIHTIKNSYIHMDHIYKIHKPAYDVIVNYFNKI